jgi:hypothetical protein
VSIFDVDYIGTVWRLLVPPDKRLPKWLAWGSAIMSGKQWFHDAIFKTYASGDVVDAPFKPVSYTYHTGDRVIYPIQSYTAGYTGANAYHGDNAVYEAVSIYPDGTNNTGFSGNQPSGNNVVPSVVPSYVTTPAQALSWLSQYYWVRVSPNFIGVYERASYSCQKIIFEFALNRWFQTTFRQPNGTPEAYTLNPSGTSDIYIKTNSNINRQFFWSQTTNISFFAPATNISDPTIELSNYFSPGYSFEKAYDFSIYIPVNVYNALVSSSIETFVIAGNNSTLRDGVVCAFADQLNQAGSIYNIITY